MRNRPPTVEQLLVLADRAERGPLTAAEAARLRRGITALDTARRASAGRLADTTRREQDAAAPLTAIRRRVRDAQRRGVRTIHVWVLARDLDDVMRDAA